MWLALRFVHWALDCHLAPSQAPILVAETRTRRQLVVAASREALAAGIRLGSGLADARLRLSHLVVLERDRAQEQAAMVRLAGWAWGYSSQLHWAVASDDIECTRLVMEVGASLRLFGGQTALIEQIRTDLACRGARYRAGLGATPQAALAFARATPAARQRGVLSALPIDCLDLPSETTSTLAASGIHRADQLLDLPTAPLNRRFGPELSAALARLYGKRPHGLPLYQIPSRYDTHHELTGAVEHVAGLVFILRRVFDELSSFLRGADSSIQSLRLILIHEREPATRLGLRLSAPTHDARHLEHIACQRLERLTLVAPVVGIKLISDRLRRSAHDQQAFWCNDGRRRGRDEWAATLDRLRARLGHDAVYWVHEYADHRPEYASVYQDIPPNSQPVDAHRQHIDPLPRPLWLLESPQIVPAEQLSQMTWLSGPERIESGWWQHGQRRDYYRALDTQGRLLWIFRDLGDTKNAPSQHYYLQGLYG